MVDFGLATGCRIGEARAIRDGSNGDGQPLLDLDAGTVEVNATAIRLSKKQAANMGLDYFGMVVQEKPKTAAGHRILALPGYAVETRRRRREELRLNPPAVQLLIGAGATVRHEKVWIAFPAPLARSVRDPSNTAADLRDVLDRTGCTACEGRGRHAAVKKNGAKPPPLWTAPDTGAVFHEPCRGTPPYWAVTFHTFRRTVAAWVDLAAAPPGRSPASSATRNRP